MSLPEPDLKFTIIVTTHTTNYHIILKNKLLYIKIQVHITTGKCFTMCFTITHLFFDVCYFEIK